MIKIKLGDASAENFLFYNIRENLTKQYIKDCKAVTGTLQEKNEKLKNIRKEYIKRYLETSPSIAEMNLANFVETLFYEFDRNYFNVHEALQARKDVWQEIANAFSAGKIEKETLISLIRYIGIEKNLYDQLPFGSLGVDFVDSFSMIDAKIVNIRIRQNHLYTNFKKMLNTFDDGPFRDQIEKIFKSKVERFFFSKDLKDKEYVKKIMLKASEWTSNNDFLASRIETLITTVDAFELSSSNDRTYLSLTYLEQEDRTRLAPQSIPDYIRNGYRTEHYYELVEQKYNPQFVKNHLPKEVSLEEDSNGYYLTQKECNITTEELKQMAKKYDKMLEGYSKT